MESVASFLISNFIIYAAYIFWFLVGYVLGKVTIILAINMK